MISLRADGEHLPPIAYPSTIYHHLMPLKGRKPIRREGETMITWHLIDVTNNKETNDGAEAPITMHLEPQSLRTTRPRPTRRTTHM